MWFFYIYYKEEEAKNRQLEQDSLSSSIGLDWCWYGTKTDPESRTTSHSSVYYLIFSLPYSSYIKVDWLITRYCASLFLADRSKIYIQSFFFLYISILIVGAHTLPYNVLLRQITEMVYRYIQHLTHAGTWVYIDSKAGAACSQQNPLWIESLLSAAACV